MEDKVDIVIPLGNGSKWDNNELRYCLRSIEKYAKNYKRIYLIGTDFPKWINPLTIDCCFFPLGTEGRPALNIMEKLFWSCGIRDISDKFLYFNDDYFLQADIDCFSHPNYYNNLLNKILPNYNGNWYSMNINNTIEALMKSNNSIYNYDVHYPMLISKIYFPSIMDDFNWKDNEYCIKSLYGNRMKVNHIQEIDCKIKGEKTLEEFEAFINPLTMFSTGDLCLTQQVKQKIAQMYPEKSRYEI